MVWKEKPLTNNKSVVYKVEENQKYLRYLNAFFEMKHFFMFVTLKCGKYLPRVSKFAVLLKSKNRLGNVRNSENTCCHVVRWN